MTQRRAPEGGYDFAAKMLYRRQVWNSFKRWVRRPKSAQVLLMPSIEGREISIAQDKGFRVDFNPAIVATLKRKWPAIHTYGVAASRACQRIADKGVRLDAANFDFTGCVSKSMLREVVAIAEAGCFAPTAAVAFTLLRGRESGALGRIVQCDSMALGEVNAGWENCGEYDLSRNDWRRLGIIKEAFSQASCYVPCLVGAGAYRSGSQTMLWASYFMSIAGKSMPDSAVMRANIAHGSWEIAQQQVKDAHEKFKSERAIVLAMKSSDFMADSDTDDIAQGDAA